MTRTFAIDANNDFLLVGANLAIVTRVQAVLNICEHAAQAILEEMVFAKDQGMPYFETVWTGTPTTAPFEAAFRTRISQVEGVTEIQELTTAQVGDVMQYTATIRTVYGTGTISNG
jgi:hypothetical protein